MPTLYLPAASAGMIASKVTFWKLAFRPSFAAIASPRSTSRPMMVLPSVSKYSFGAYVASLAIVMVPADLIAAGTSDAGSLPAAAVLEPAAAGLEPVAAAVAAGELGLAGVVFLLEQPLKTKAAAMAKTPAAWVMVRGRSGVTIPPGTGQSRPGDVRPEGRPGLALIMYGCILPARNAPDTRAIGKDPTTKPGRPCRTLMSRRRRTAYRRFRAGRHRLRVRFARPFTGLDCR